MVCHRPVNGMTFTAHGYTAILEQEGAGDLAWMIASTDDETGEPYPDYDRFTFYSDADVPSICAHALDMSLSRRRSE